MEKNNLEQWLETSEGLYRSFLFRDFTEAFGFMSKVALNAEKMNHHPSWKNSYRKVEIWLITHEAGNSITAKDYELAQKIDALLD